jgi:hypothetical protein
VEDLHTGDGETVLAPAEHAEHWVLGWQRDFSSGIQVRLEGYRKLYSDPHAEFRNYRDGLVFFPEMEFDRVKVYCGSSEARGVEFFLKRDTGGKLSWWASYIWARATDYVKEMRFANGQLAPYNRDFPGMQDQRHTLYLDVNLKPNYKWQWNLAFQAHSGWPYTDVYLGQALQPDGRTRYYLQSGPPWGERMDPYWRLDLRVNRYFNISRGRLTAFVEVINVTDHENIRNFDYSIVCDEIDCVLRRTARYWFGSLPSFGITYSLSL